MKHLEPFEGLDNSDFAFAFSIDADHLLFPDTGLYVDVYQAKSSTSEGINAIGHKIISPHSDGIVRGALLSSGAADESDQS